MCLAVGDVFDQGMIALGMSEDLMHHIDVRPLAEAAEVIDLTLTSMFKGK
jgi:hypothetical protein